MSKRLRLSRVLQLAKQKNAQKNHVGSIALVAVVLSVFSLFDTSLQIHKFLPVDFTTPTTDAEMDPSTSSDGSEQRNVTVPQYTNVQDDDKKKKHRLFNMPINADDAWKFLLMEGAQMMKTNKAPLAAMEVGMHRATQCIRAAEFEFQAYCVEPSPKSFEICEKAVRSRNQDVQDRIHLYNVAAGSTSGIEVDFVASGSTGDSVGEVESDMWTMTKKRRTPGSTNTNGRNIVKVKTSTLDDLISKNISPGTEIFVAKIDVQGFEPYVFQGLSESIQQNRIMFILFEYWPKGMDFIMDEPFDGDGICKASVKILENLINAGYKLFALNHEVHPHSFSHRQSKQPNATSYKKLFSVVDQRPLDNLMKNCMWYYKLEREIFPQEDYFIGFWSDFIAVSPKARFEQPSTPEGKFMRPILSGLSR